MKKKFLKTIAILMCTSSFIGCVGPATVMAAEETSIVESTGENQTRENFTMENGSFNEGSYVYTYDENGTHYKVVEETDASFQNVTSYTYTVDEEGDCSLVKTVQSYIDGKNVIIETTTPDGQTDVETISPQAARIIPYSDGTTGEWVTQSYDSQVYVKGSPIATIAQLLFMALGVVLAEKIPAKLFVIAESLFNRNSESVYTHETYSYMLSDTNQFVIVREAVSVMYFLDSAHKYYIDSYYDEFDGRGVIIS